MAGRSREKIALFIFTLIVVGGLFVAAAYVIASHSLNIAATHIDDIFGSMDDYSVLVFEGTIDPETSDEDRDNGVPGADGDAPAGTPSVPSPDDPANAGAAGDDAEPHPDDAGDDDVDPIAALAALAGSPLGSAGSESDPVIAADVVDEYRAKGADAIELSVADPSVYATGSVVTLGALRIGVFSTDDLMPASEVARMVRYFDAHDVDVVVAIAPMRNYVRSLDGVDVLITTADASATSLGSTVDGAFVVQAPEKGSVGVVMIAPSTVVSSKVVAP